MPTTTRMDSKESPNAALSSPPPLPALKGCRGSPADAYGVLDENLYIPPPPAGSPFPPDREKRNRPTITAETQESARATPAIRHGADRCNYGIVLKKDETIGRDAPAVLQQTPTLSRARRWKRRGFPEMSEARVRGCGGGGCRGGAAKKALRHILEVFFFFFVHWFLSF